MREFAAWPWTDIAPCQNFLQAFKVICISASPYCFLSASSADSSCVRRLVLEYGYNPLAAVTRSRNAAWNVPKARLIEFGLVFEV